MIRVTLFYANGAIFRVVDVPARQRNMAERTAAAMVATDNHLFAYGIEVI